MGQGDSSLITLPGNANILIDGGPANGKATSELEKTLPLLQRYIDLVIMTHPELDHYGGIIEVLERYEVGGLLSTGKIKESKEFQELIKVVEKKKIPHVTLGAGDTIEFIGSKLRVISPTKRLLTDAPVNETSLVTELESSGILALFTGDSGFEAENEFIKNVRDVNVLKVGHHGSRFSTGRDLLETIRPEISVITVGKNNYGHPTEDVLTRLKSVQSKVFRTDTNGTIEITSNGKSISIFSENTIE